MDSLLLVPQQSVGSITITITITITKATDVM
jgi:hypothetical protein